MLKALSSLKQGLSEQVKIIFNHHCGCVRSFSVPVLCRVQWLLEANTTCAMVCGKPVLLGCVEQGKDDVRKGLKEV